MKLSLRSAVISLTLIITFVLSTVNHTMASSGYGKLLTLGRGSIESAQWHPSGKRIAVNTNNGGAWFYDDKLQGVAHLEDVRLASFNAMGDLLVVAQGNQVVLLDAMILERVRSLGDADGKILAMYWSPDGKKLAVITDKPMVTVWDVGTARVLLTFRQPIDDYGSRYVFWSPHSDKIATFDADYAYMEIWNVDTCQLEHKFNVTDAGRGGLGGKLIWNPDNIHILRAVSSENEVFQHWDTGTGTLLYEHTSNGTGIAFNSDGTQLVMTKFYGMGEIVDPITFQPRRDLEQAGDAYRLAWSPDDSLLVGSGVQSFSQPSGSILFAYDSFIQVWDMATGKVLHRFETHSFVESIVWSPDSRHILSFNRDNMLRILDAYTGKLAHERDEHGIIGSEVAWSSDGSQIAVADKIGGVRIWDAESGQLIQTLTGHGDTMLIAWQPAGELLAIVSYSGGSWGSLHELRFHIWNTTTGQLVALSYLVPEALASFVTWDQQGRRLIVTGWDGRVWVWDAPNLLNVSWGKNGDPIGGLSIRSAKFSPDGKYILMLSAICCHGGGLSPSIWDATTHKLLENIDVYPGTYAWDRAGERLYAAYGGQKPIYMLAGTEVTPKDYYVNVQLVFQAGMTGVIDTSPVITLKGHNGWVTSILWNVDATRIATTSEDKTLRIWDAQTGQNLLTVEDVLTAVWSPDGTTLAVRGEQAGTRIINAASGEVLDTVEILSTTPSWSPDSTKIADVNNGILTIWGKE